MTLAPVHPDECHAIADFCERVILTAVHASQEQKAAFVANVRKNIQVWQQSPESGLHMKALVRDRLAGVVLVRDYWNLCNLFVAPDLHRLGIGGTLIKFAIGECRSRSARGYIRLNSSQNAIEFYRRMGFNEVSDPQPTDRGTPFQLDF